MALINKITYYISKVNNKAGRAEIQGHDVYRLARRQSMIESDTFNPTKIIGPDDACEMSEEPINMVNEAVSDILFSQDESKQEETGFSIYA